MEAGENNTEPWVEVIDFENRRYPRLDFHLPAEYDQIKSSITHTGNIGEDSLMIHLPTRMDVSQPPRLKLFFSLGSELNTIRLPAEVVWMDTNSSKNAENYQYGVKSIDISPEDETMLKTC